MFNLFGSPRLILFSKIYSVYLSMAHFIETKLMQETSPFGREILTMVTRVIKKISEHRDIDLASGKVHCAYQDRLL